MKVELLGYLSNVVGSRELELRIGGHLSLKEALQMLPKEVRERVLDEDGRIRPSLLVLVNDTDVKVVGETVKVSDMDKVTIIPAFHGGRHVT